MIGGFDGWLNCGLNEWMIEWVVIETVNNELLVEEITCWINEWVN